MTENRVVGYIREMTNEPSQRRRPNPLVVGGIVLVAMGCLVGAVSPFVDDPRVFVMLLGSSFAFAIGMWLVVRMIGYVANPNRPMESGKLAEDITGTDS